MFSSLIVFAVFGFVQGTEYGRVTADPGDGETIILDVSLDNDSMIVIPGTPDPPLDCFRNSINLHVFSKQLVAIKIVDKDVCYIRDSTENYEDAHKRLTEANEGVGEPVTQTSEEFIIAKERVPKENVEEKYGPKISDFCTGYDVFELQDGHPIGNRDFRRVESGDCTNCWKCRVKTKKGSN